MSSDSTTFYRLGIFANKKILIDTKLAGNLQCFYSYFCQWYENEQLVPTPRKSEETDFEPEQLTTITKCERNTSQARGDPMLKFTANREKLIHRASENAKNCQNGGD